MTNWKKYKFSDFVDINPAIPLHKNGKYSFIEMADLNNGQRYVYPSTQRELTGGSRFQENDTLFARITPCLENGKICQAKNLKDGIGFGSTEFLVFRGKQNVSDSNFVFYLSRWEEVRKFAEQHMVGTSGRQRVPKEVFDNLEITLPDLHTQTRIAEILSSLDDKIELNRQMNQTFAFWHYSIPSFDEGKCPKMESSESILSNKFIVRSNSILFSKLNPRFARVWPVGRIDESKAICSTEFLVFIPIEMHLYSHLKMVLTQVEFLENLVSKATGTSGSHQRVKPDDILEAEILVPSMEAAKKLDKELRPLIDLEIKNIEESSQLRLIRDSLIPKLMSGEIDFNLGVDAVSR